MSNQWIGFDQGGQENKYLHLGQNPIQETIVPTYFQRARADTLVSSEGSHLGQTHQLGPFSPTFLWNHPGNQTFRTTMSTPQASALSGATFDTGNSTGQDVTNGFAQSVSRNPDNRRSQSILHQARDILENKLPMGSAAQTVSESSDLSGSLPRSATFQQWVNSTPNMAVNNQMYKGTALPPFDATDLISNHLERLTLIKEKPDTQMGPPGDLSNRPWNTVPRNFMDNKPARSTVLGSASIFDAPPATAALTTGFSEMSPAPFVQYPPGPSSQQGAPTFFSPSPWGAIGEQRGQRFGGESIFTPQSIPGSVTLRKKPSDAPLYQQSIGYGRNGSYSPEKDALFPVAQPVPMALQTAMEAAENSLPKFSVNEDGSPRKYNPFTSPRKLPFAPMSATTEEEDWYGCSVDCFSKRQVDQLRVDNDYLKRLINEAQEAFNFRQEYNVRKIHQLEAVNNVLKEQNQLLTQELTELKLANKAAAAGNSTASASQTEMVGSDNMKFSAETNKADDYFREEFQMLFRTMNCWASRYLQFPNGEAIPTAVADYIKSMFINQDDQKLIHSEKTKSFVISAIMSRQFRDKIFAEDKFLRGVTVKFMEEVKKDGGNSNKSNDDIFDEIVSASAEIIANDLQNFIRPLLSRLHDGNAAESSRKALISMTQQAARLAVQLNRNAKGKKWFIQFPAQGEAFKDSCMINAEDQRRGVSEGQASSSALVVKLASLPLVYRQDQGASAPVLIHKASVLLM